MKNCLIWYFGFLTASIANRVDRHDYSTIHFPIVLMIIVLIMIVIEFQWERSSVVDAN
jgi:hypothetical protein